MAAVVLQRYLLSASNPGGSVPASGVFLNNASSAAVPLGSVWTIRLRWIAGTLVTGDNSGQISIENVRLFWQFNNPQGNSLFQLDMVVSWITPYYQTAPFVMGFTTARDADQTISSLDQIGGVVATVNANGAWAGKNLDAANPHSVSFQLAAIMEFETAGSGE